MSVSSGAIILQLIADQIEVNRGVRTIVPATSFTVSRGDALLLTGANGAGKTTLLRALAGYLPLAAGHVSLAGGDADTPIREQCHVVSHNNGLKAKLTVRENLQFWQSFLNGRAATREDDEKISAALDQFAIAGLAEFFAGELSAGQKRRVALARLIAVTRPVWLLDEPSVSLDQASTQQLVEAGNQHLASGGLIVAASHLPLPFDGARALQLGAERRAA